MFSDDTLSLKYEKKLMCGGVDNFDSYLVYINIEDLYIEFLYKGESCFIESKDSLIGEKLAYEKATLNKLTNLTYVELSTVRNESSEILLAYNFENQEQRICIDAYSGDVLLIEPFKAIRGGTIGATDISTAYSSLVIAKSGMENLGYTTTSISYTSDFASVVPNVLKRGFYACCHGSTVSLCSNVGTSFSYSDVPTGTYRLVFLDACNTALNSNWSNAFGITSNSTNKVFLGWSSSVGASSTYHFCQYFWQYVDTGMPLKYVAIAGVADEGSGLPLVFVGDDYYDGHYM